MPPRLHQLPASWTWLSVFLPALVYLVTTRVGSGPSGRTALMVASADGCRRLQKALKLFCPTTSTEIPLSLIQEAGTLGYIVHQVWKHDDELGRGYLLSSDASRKGRVWRWEVGGGPIELGRTLHLEDAGCRSRESCQGGAGGLAVDFFQQSRYRQGRLVVAEWGEERIARLEESGTRTPLVIQVPDPCHENEMRRLQRPTRLLYTPFGDLLILDYMEECQTSVIYRLKHATHVPALQSLAVSRQAHEWTTLEYTHGTPDILYQTANETTLGDMVLTPDWTSVYLSMVDQQGIGLLKLDLLSDEDEDEDEDEAAKTAPRVAIVASLSNLDVALDNRASPLEVTQTGLVLWGVTGAVLLFDPQEGVLGHVDIPASPQSLTLGEDGYLYVALRDFLWRMPFKELPVAVPVDMVRKPDTVA